jgi:hypothetical protein
MKKNSAAPTFAVSVQCTQLVSCERADIELVGKGGVIIKSDPHLQQHKKPVKLMTFPNDLVMQYLYGTASARRYMTAAQTEANKRQNCTSYADANVSLIEDFARKRAIAFPSLGSGSGGASVPGPPAPSVPHASSAAGTASAPERRSAGAPEQQKKQGTP